MADGFRGVAPGHFDVTEAGMPVRSMLLVGIPYKSELLAPQSLLRLARTGLNSDVSIVHYIVHQTAIRIEDEVDHGVSSCHE